jgi:sigma-B regulation protein RsbU (phosphoserine phosphatase)
MPAMLGGLYWKRGNRVGAISGILLGSLIWLYTLLLPSFSKSGWVSETLLSNGPFGIALLKPTELFGLNGMDLWSHSLFWSMLFNVSSYITCSILLKQNEHEHDQVHRFIGIFGREDTQRHTERKRLSKPVTRSLVTLMSKFIGETEARRALDHYTRERNITDGAVSEFDLPDLNVLLKRPWPDCWCGHAIVNHFLSGTVPAWSRSMIFSAASVPISTKTESLLYACCPK